MVGGVLVSGAEEIQRSWNVSRVRTVPECWEPHTDLFVYLPIDVPRGLVPFVFRDNLGRSVALRRFFLTPRVAPCP